MRSRSRRYRVAALAVVLPLAACGANASGTPVINLYNAPQEHMADIVSHCNSAAGGRYRIVLNTLPRDADSQREQLVRRLAARDSGLDVLGLDVTWTAELAEAGWIRPWTGENATEAERGTLAGPLDTAMWQGKLYAAPYNSNVQLLWYRSNLVPSPPTTWAGMISEATRLARENKPHYVEVTGAQYEGLVVWFNSLVAAEGGRILNPAGTQVELGAPALKALRVMRTFARSAAADPSLANTQEDQARLAMEGGTAAMEINWPFVYASMATNKPKMLPTFKWAPYPGISGPGRSPLGGANFGISRYSQHPTQAFEAALCLRDATSQKIAAVQDGLPPTLESLYGDADVIKAYPMHAAILTALKTAVARPKTPTYQNVSTVTSAILSPPQSIDPPKTLASLRSQISDALQSKGVLP